MPTLVACGARDRANLGPSREIAASVPTAELCIVPDAVHLWNLQQPELFNQTVAEFVARHSDHLRGSGDSSTERVDRPGRERQ